MTDDQDIRARLATKEGREAAKRDVYGFPGDEYSDWGKIILAALGLLDEWEDLMLLWRKRMDHVSAEENALEELEAENNTLRCMLDEKDNELAGWKYPEDAPVEEALPPPWLDAPDGPGWWWMWCFDRDEPEVLAVRVNWIVTRKTRFLALAHTKVYVENYKAKWRRLTPPDPPGGE